MTSLEIQFELKKKNKTQKTIAELLGVSEMAVSRVINRQIVSDRIMKAVAAALGEDHRYIFSDYYMRPAKRTTSKVAAL